MNITKYKKLNMTEHKADMNITKIDKYKKKLNINSMMEHWTHEHYWKTEQHFYEGTLNRTQPRFDESNNKHTRSCFDKVE